MQRPAQTNLGIEPAILVKIYRQMSRIRAVDKAIQAGLSGGKFLFSYWPMTGQESIPATISQLISSRDYMVTTYRGIHDQVAKGVPLVGLFAEALGRIDGVNKGKGGSPHISDPSSGSMLTTAIVGAGAPIANGLALAAKMRAEDRITIVNFGDGATSIGAVHEAMNLAGVWKLPVIFHVPEQPDRRIHADSGLHRQQGFCLACCRLRIQRREAGCQRRARLLSGHEEGRGRSPSRRRSDFRRGRHHEARTACGRRRLTRGVGRGSSRPPRRPGRYHASAPSCSRPASAPNSN